MKQLAAILSCIIFVMALSYLGWRSIEHEVLMRQHQQRMLAQSRLENIKSSIESLLNQRSVYLISLIQLLEKGVGTFDNLLQSQSDIKNAFEIRHNNIVYISNSNDLQWVKFVESIKYDNAILINPNSSNELSQPTSGWYQSYDHLIFWSKQGNLIKGFELSTIKFALDIIRLFEDQSIDDNFSLYDGSKQIYVHGQSTINDINVMLDYPLQNWQLTYYYSSPNFITFYWLGGGILFLFIVLVIGIVCYVYREYTRAIRLAKQQVSFVGQVSHEFKTPLTNITLYSEMLKEQLTDEPFPVPEYLDVITSESQRLTRLVQNVLNLNKPAKQNFKAVNLTLLIERVYQTFNPVLKTKSLQLNLMLNSNKNHTIFTDEDSVMQIISNFLSNAEKYAVDGKKVDLSLTTNDKQTIITVRDYGRGIPKHLLKKIFKPFYRINSSITEGVSGTGIGLTIANQLAQQLQGTIKVTNENPGTAFSLILTEHVHEDFNR